MRNQGSCDVELGSPGPCPLALPPPSMTLWPLPCQGPTPDQLSSEECEEPATDHPSFSAQLSWLEPSAVYPAGFQRGWAWTREGEGAPPRVPSCPREEQHLDSVARWHPKVFRVEA